MIVYHQVGCDIEWWGDMEESYLFHGSWLNMNSVYNGISQECLCRLVTEGFFSPTLNLMAIIKWKSLMFRDDMKFWSKVIFSKHVLGWDMQRHLFDLCMSQIVTVLTEEIRINYKIPFCSKLPHIDGATLNNFGCVYLTETQCAMNQLFLRFEKRGCSDISL